MPGYSLPQPWRLLELRARIQMLDTEIIALLARRFEVMRDIRAFKQANGLPLYDPRREREVLMHCLALAADMKLPANLIRTLYQGVFEAARGALLTNIKENASRNKQTAGQAPEPSGDVSKGKCHE